MITPVFFNAYINANHRSVGELTQALFDRCSKLLVIRVDFLYKQEFREYLTLEVVQEHRNRLLDNRRRHPSLFGHLKGYAWSMEHGSYRLESGEDGSGWHHHFLFFFDGQRVESEWLGMGIARYFDTTITHGMASSFVCNLHKEKFIEQDTLGIGMVRHDDIPMRNNLLDGVAGYLAKGTMPHEHRDIYDQYSHVRRFGRSRMPAPLPEGPRVGRPRKSLATGREGGL